MHNINPGCGLSDGALFLSVQKSLISTCVLMWVPRARAGDEETPHMDKYWLLPRKRTDDISEMPLESPKIDMLRSVDALHLCACTLLYANRPLADLFSSFSQTCKGIIASANRFRERRTRIFLRYALVPPASRKLRLLVCEVIMRVSLWVALIQWAQYNLTLAVSNWPAQRRCACLAGLREPPRQAAAPARSGYPWCCKSRDQCDGDPHDSQYDFFVDRGARHHPAPTRNPAHLLHCGAWRPPPSRDQRRPRILPGRRHDRGECRGRALRAPSSARRFCEQSPHCVLFVHLRVRPT